MFDCASHAPGPLLNTFKEKKCYLKIDMLQLLSGEKCFTLWLVFLIEENSVYASSGGHICFSAATLFKATNTISKQELLS